jgi:hypothetical protein
VSASVLVASVLVASLLLPVGRRIRRVWSRYSAARRVAAADLDVVAEDPGRRWWGGEVFLILTGHPELLDLDLPRSAASSTPSLRGSLSPRVMTGVRR